MARTLLRWVAPGFPGPSAALPIRKPRAVRMLPPAAIKTHSSSGAGGGGNYVQLTDEELMGQCEMDRFKSSGPGGQHRNKTESAVRLKHLPTGIIAQAVEDRSQHKNRASALARLRTLLALKGRKSTLINIVLHQNLFRFFLQSRQLDIQILVLKLVLKIQSLLRGCKLYLT